jgi:hypothetical protein
MFSLLAIYPLNQICAKAFFAVILFFGFTISKFFKRSNPSGLNPNSPFSKSSGSLPTAYFLP